MPIKLNGSGSGSVALNAPANTSGGSDISFTLPTADGTSGQVLQTNGSGALSFASASSDNITEGNTSVEVVDTGSNGEVRFTTEGTRAATIDSSSRLLVGTSSAYTTFNYAGGDRSARFQVYGTGIDTGSMALIRTSEWPIFYFASGGTSNVSNGSSLGAHVYTGYHTSKYYTGADIRCEVDSTPAVNSVPGRLIFSTTAYGASTPTERMRIRNNGLTTLVTTANIIDVGTTQGAGTSYWLFTGRYGATDGSGFTGTASIIIYSNGNIQNTNGSYTQLSDIKLKENIVDAGSQWDDLKAIQIRNWNFKAETGYETHRQIGPIAQELEQVCPGLVFDAPDRDEDGNETGEVTKGVNQSVLYMKAVKALQEAMERIETLEAANAALEARLTALEGGAS